MRGSGAECATGPCASGGDDSAEGIGFEFGRQAQGSDVDKAVACISFGR
jgi:hypothetical protein